LEARIVEVELTRQAIKDSPEGKPTTVINREFEERRHRHYRRQTYWDDNDGYGCRPRTILNAVTADFT
jgi:hypothetical protein